ncbi:hypothetical protein ACHQM5_014551 [Ranunculus cassubicifolius]
MDPIYCARVRFLEFFKVAAANVLLTSRDPNGHSVISIAAEWGHLDCCEEIYRRCPSLLYNKSNQGDTALHLAAWSEKPEVVKFLIYAEGLEVPNKKLMMMVTKHHETALHLSVEKGNLKIIKLFVEADLDKELMRMVDRYQETVFHSAVRKSNLEAVELMLEVLALVRCRICWVV